MLLQSAKPLLAQLGSSLDSLVPDNREVSSGAEVLSHCDRSVQVENNMPVATGDEDGLAGMLD